MRISDWSSDVCSSDLSALCAACGARQDWYGPMGEGRACAACGAPALRPDIVFFGEMPYAMDRIERALAAADLFVSIGTSGAVYPAAGFVQTARSEEHTSELQSLMRISYAVFCLKKK